MKWVIAVTSVVVPAILLYGGCQALFPTYKHRFKLTVSIEADGKLHSGAGIIEVAWKSSGPFTGIAHSEFSQQVRGQGAAVDLGDRGFVVANVKLHPFQRELLPRPADGQALAFLGYYGSKWWTGPTKPNLYRDRIKTIATEKGPRQLSRDQYPGFVWLPKSAQHSPQAVVPEDFPTVIGKGVELRSVIVEITTDDFSSEITNQLQRFVTDRAESDLKLGTLLPDKYVFTTNQILVR